MGGNLAIQLVNKRPHIWNGVVLLAPAIMPHKASATPVMLSAVRYTCRGHHSSNNGALPFLSVTDQSVRPLVGGLGCDVSLPPRLLAKYLPKFVPFTSAPWRSTIDKDISAFHCFPLSLSLHVCVRGRLVSLTGLVLPIGLTPTRSQLLRL
jgi:hypothetical protein